MGTEGQPQGMSNSGGRSLTPLDAFSRTGQVHLAPHVSLVLSVLKKTQAHHNAWAPVDAHAWPTPNTYAPAKCPLKASLGRQLSSTPFLHSLQLALQGLQLLLCKAGLF